jgi:hypothetical protein
VHDLFLASERGLSVITPVFGGVGTSGVSSVVSTFAVKNASGVLGELFAKVSPGEQGKLYVSGLSWQYEPGGIGFGGMFLTVTATGRDPDERQKAATDLDAFKLRCCELVQPTGGGGGVSLSGTKNAIGTVIAFSIAMKTTDLFVVAQVVKLLELSGIGTIRNMNAGGLERFVLQGQIEIAHKAFHDATFNVPYLRDFVQRGLHEIGGGTVTRFQELWGEGMLPS